MDVKKKEYLKPIITFIPLKIEERLVACGKVPGNSNICLGTNNDDKTPNMS